MNTAVVIFVIVIIILAIVVLFYTTRQQTGPFLSGTFTVKTGTGASGTKVFFIDGKPQPALTLRLGCIYRFILYEKNFPFYLTTSPKGGNGAPGNLFPQIDTVGASIFDLVVTSNLPPTFYYQSTVQENMGGSITIV